MALYPEIGAELRRLCDAAFAEDSDTGYLVRQFNEMAADFAETGTNDFDAWLPIQAEFLIYLRGRDEEWPSFAAALRENITPRTDYLCIVLYLLERAANGPGDHVPVDPSILTALSRLINDRGGPGASMRNQYLHYLHQNMNTIITSEV